MAQQSYTTSSSSNNPEKSGAEKKSGTSKREEENVKDIYERMQWQEPDPTFEKFRRNGDNDFSKKENNDDFSQDFKSDFASDRDPLESPSSSSAEDRIKFSQVPFHQTIFLSCGLCQEARPFTFEIFEDTWCFLYVVSFDLQNCGLLKCP